MILKVIFFAFFCLLSFSNIALSQKISKNDSVNFYFNEAIKLMNQEKPKDAIILLDKAISFDSSVILLYYEKALALTQLKKYDESVSILSSLLNHKNTNDRIYHLLGMSYVFKNQIDSALLIFTNGLTRFKKSGLLYYELGSISYSQQNKKNARSFWESGVFADPLYPGNYYELAKYWRNSGEKIWGLFYAEIFMLITKNEKQRNEVSRLLYEMYDYVFTKEKNTDKVFFTSSYYKREEPLDTSKDAFEICFDKSMKYALNKENEGKIDTLSIAKLLNIRKTFLNYWFSNSLDVKYSNVLLDYQKVVLDSGYFDEYNYWLFQFGNMKESATWQNKNKDRIKKFSEWYFENMLRITDKNFFTKSLYDR